MKKSRLFHRQVPYPDIKLQGIVYGCIGKNEVDRKMRKPKKCPKCNSTDETIPIKYGFPSPEMKYEWAAGKIELGGCIVEPGNPNWHCKKCNNRW